MIQELTPQVLSIALFLLMLVATAVTLPVSWLLLWRYRRAVTRAMSARVAAAGASSDRGARAASPTPTSSVADPGAPPMPAVPADRLYRHLVRDPWRYALIHAVAGLGFALIMTIAMFVV